VADRDRPQGPQKELRVRNIIAGRSSSKEMTVERLSVNTNDTKSAESDLMLEVAKAITEQTKTLGDVLREIRAQSKDQLAAFKALAKDLDPKDMPAAMANALKTLGVGSPSGDGGTTAAVNQVDTDLKKSLKDLSDAIKGLAGTETAGTGDSGGGSPGSGPGEAKQQAKNFGRAVSFAEAFISSTKLGDLEAAINRRQEIEDDLNEELLKAGKKQKASLGLFLADAAVSEINSNITNMIGSIQRATTSLFDMGKVTERITEQMNNAFAASTSGVTSFGDYFLDFAPGFVRGGDNLKSTLATVKTSLEGGLINPLGTMGDDLFGVSEALYKTRSDFRSQGVDAMSRMGFEESNEAIVGLFALERRRDVGASISSSMTTRNMAKQLEFAQLIATNTGQTALEVLKANQERAKEIANLQAGGVLGSPDGENFTKAMAAFTGAGMTGFSDMIAGIAKAGGDPTLYLAQNQDFAQGLAATGKNAEFYDLVNAIRGGADPNQIMQLAGRMGGGVGGTSNAALSTVIGDQMTNLAGESGMAMKFKDAEEPDWLTGAKTYITDLYNNNGGQLISSAVAFIANTGALMLNTAALWANTGALGGGMLGGLMGGLKGVGRGIAGAGRGLKGIAGKGLGMLAGGAGAAGSMAMAGGKAAAGGLGKMGLKSLVKKIPIIGLLASLGFGASRAFSGDFSGAGLELASGLAGTLPGLGTAASLGIDAALAAKDMGAFGEVSPSSSSSSSLVGPTQDTSSTNAGIRNDTQRLISETNRLLDRLLVLTQDEVDVLKDIKGNTSRVNITESPGFWDRYFGDEPLPASGTAAPG
jgi:hypothetical protein